jgi:hypothetical protein
MADARRIVFGAEVFVKEGDTAEENIGTNWIMSPGIPKQGGQASHTISSTQIDDSWTSMMHKGTGWANYTDSKDYHKWASGNTRTWGEQGVGRVKIPWYGSGNTQLKTHSTRVDDDVKYLYIKNLEPPESVSGVGTGYIYVSIHGEDTSNGDFILYPGDSLNILGSDTPFHCDDIWLRHFHHPTIDIEYIVAT